MYYIFIRKILYCEKRIQNVLLTIRKQSIFNHYVTKTYGEDVQICSKEMTLDVTITLKTEKKHSACCNICVLTRAMTQTNHIF